jgi:hypothetical protein
MATKRIATTALDWGVLAAKIPAENKVRMHYHASSPPGLKDILASTPHCWKYFLLFPAVLWIRISFSPDLDPAFYLNADPVSGSVVDGS